MNNVESMHAKLHDAFLEDHQQLTRGLSSMSEAIRCNNIAEAKSIAEKLNIQVGPHIEFEERVFYPRLISILGESEVEKLYAEHQDGLAALCAMLEVDLSVELSEQQRTKLVSAIDAALEHAFSCGTLLSHLDNVDDNDIAELIAQLEYYRERATPWTSLTSHVTQ